MSQGNRDLKMKITYLSWLGILFENIFFGSSINFHFLASIRTPTDSFLLIFLKFYMDMTQKQQ